MARGGRGGKKQARCDNQQDSGSNKKHRTTSEEQPDRENSRTRYEDYVFRNDDFVAYYKAQQLVPEDEFEVMMTTLGKQLPMTFRINSSCAFPQHVRDYIEQNGSFKDLVIENDQQVDSIRCMEWYPHQKAFHWNLSRFALKKTKNEQLKTFHRWMVNMAESGTLTRQETVSMIPPLILDIQSHHKILDMCAAPGSKTCQLIEMLHADEALTGELPTGFVVANDLNIIRANLLIHQCKRIESPALIITCAKAQNFPNHEREVFDRILCDVPCSGDGTLRKNPDIWKSWSPKSGLGLFRQQLQIAKRGIDLLAVDGYLCYSTCSFNPIENEAVVAQLWRDYAGCLEIVSVASKLPLFKRRPGLSTWVVMDAALKVVPNTYDGTKESLPAKILPSMFPPTLLEANAMGLEHCMRCLPQDQDTGGFFVCLLRKVATTDKKKQPSVEVTTASASVLPHVSEVTVLPPIESPALTSQQPGVSEDLVNVDPVLHLDLSKVPFLAKNTRGIDRLCVEETPRTFVKPVSQRPLLKDAYRTIQAPTSLLWQRVVSFYGLAPSFPITSLLTRADSEKVITYATPATTAYFHVLQQRQLRVIHVGVKVFEKSEMVGYSCVYRLTQVGARILAPLMSKRVVSVTALEFQTLMEKRGQSLPIMIFQNPFQEAMLALEQGALIAQLRMVPSSSADKAMRVQGDLLSLVIWRGRTTVNVMANSVDIVTLLASMKAFKCYKEHPVVEVVADPVPVETSASTTVVCPEGQVEEVPMEVSPATVDIPSSDFPVVLSSDL